MQNNPSIYTKTVQTHKSKDWAIATNNSAAVDTQGFSHAIIVVNAGTATGSGTLTVTVEQSLVSGSGFAAITDAAMTAITSATDDAIFVGSIRLDPVKQYVRVVGTVAVAAVQFSSSVVLMDPARSADQADQTFAFEV